MYFKNEPTNEEFKFQLFGSIMLFITKDNVEFDMRQRHLQASGRAMTLFWTLFKWRYI
jgi:hypothetical protein